ncbi:MAG TPA: M2 family metallopeptidase [Pirellulales bacterium]|nr:M2 family metallopeptidase [Pirellulales bacterium]
MVSADHGAAQDKSTATDSAASQFVAMHEAQVRPLEIALNLAWWKANTNGKDEDFAAKVEAQNRYDQALADRDRFASLKAIREDKVKDPILSREIEVLYRAYLEKQVDPELLKRITSKSNEIEKAFNVYRAKLNDHEIADSQVRSILKESKDSAERQAVWESSKGVAKVVANDLKELVFLRNEAARKLGFKDFHAMRLYLSEQDQDQVLKLFDELDALTREPFAAVKGDIDLKMAANYGIDVDELRPWHYHDPFFQESPAIYGTNLDKVFANADILALCRKFYAGIGLPIDDVIARSDLYEKPGKSPHAFCTDIDRAGDVRVLANIVPNEYWMGTMLHELGHSVYSSKNIPIDLPYVLRTEAHILTTEGVAMMFERFSKSGEWLEQMGVSVPDAKVYSDTGAKMRRNQLLIFSRWCQVMLRFEKELYGNPGQDLNRLWWDLVEKYQLIKRPVGRNGSDYASKIHIVSAPAYYHNYMMGQLFACQVHATIAREVLHSSDPPRAIYAHDLAVGEFMKRRVFAPGARLSWNDLTKHATGEALNAKAFAAEFTAR